jgi:GntR family phosphonate transport system transcriptional regulator
VKWGGRFCLKLAKIERYRNFPHHSRAIVSQETLPIYMQIANELRQDLQQGDYKVGNRLPTESQLSHRFGVNRHTLRRAIEVLKGEGLVRVEKGRGIFVTASPIHYPIGKRVRYNDALKAQGWTPGYRLLRTTEVSVDDEIAQKMEISPGESVALIERLGLADGEPVDISTSYFPLQRFPDILQQFRGIQSVSRMLHEVYGCDHIRRCTYISARSVRLYDARLLQLPLNQPILLAESINVDESGAVVEYGVTRFRGDRMKLVFENEL